MGGGPQVECVECARAGRCGSEAARYRDSLFLWARGAEPLRCGLFAEDVRCALGFPPRTPLYFGGK